ncbi:hypothetical protein [Edwardsiella tarda]|uniref:hypothetical protein n=1 Tax=Edwardsiella tarda TaxID=636 RepID=UPI003D2EB022
MSKELMCTLANRTREFIQSNCKKLNLHRVGRFPKGSCETSSLLLGKILSDQFPYENIYFVQGENRLNEETHFWVQARDLIFDITADQFQEIRQPMIGESLLTMSCYFTTTEISSIQCALIKNDYSNTRINEFQQISDIIRDIKTIL